MTISEIVERHHRAIIGVLLVVVTFFLTACIFHDVIPICHLLFGCDHKLHVINAALSLVTTFTGF
jgi:hypothetical protein